MTTPTDASSRERYETLLRVLDYQSGGRQGPAPRRHCIMGVLCHAGWGPADMAATIKAARDNDDLWQFTDPAAGTERLVLATPAALRATATWLAERDDPPTELVGAANRRLMALQDQADADPAQTTAGAAGGDA